MALEPRVTPPILTTALSPLTLLVDTPDNQGQKNGRGVKLLEGEGGL
jgi:hypothetical protein